MQKQKRITLNAEKRKVIADQFQSFYEDKVKQKLIDAKENYDQMRLNAKEIIEQVVRQHQPQEDVDTIRRMRNKYGNSGGELYEDNCFYVQRPITKVDDEGREYESKDEVHVRFVYLAGDTRQFPGLLRAEGGEALAGHLTGNL